MAKDAKAVRDHPRVCGEQQAPWYRTPRRLGSSPRVRGAASAMRLILIFIGIIPACAGSSYHGAVAAAQARDHPRVCGEQIAKAVQTIINAGSSPRVRGAGKPCNVWDFSNGIIPACAGSSMARYGVSPDVRDHPRVCGEQLAENLDALLVKGSSPRVRGAAAIARVDDAGRGIIPACAGSSAFLNDSTGGRRDHPRVCGEQVMPFVFSSSR